MHFYVDIYYYNFVILVFSQALLGSSSSGVLSSSAWTLLPTGGLLTGFGTTMWGKSVPSPLLEVSLYGLSYAFLSERCYRRNTLLVLVGRLRLTALFRIVVVVRGGSGWSLFE